MSRTALYPKDTSAMPHVFEPLADDDAGRSGGADVADPLEVARREAYEQGLQEGQREATTALQGVASALADAAGRFDDELRRAMESLQHEAVQLSIAIARQVVMSEVKSRPQVMERVVSRLLSDANGRKVSAILLNPEDAERLGALPVMETLREAGISINASDDVAPGGCVLETAFGRLDAQLETRMEEVAAALASQEENDTSGADEGAES